MAGEAFGLKPEAKATLANLGHSLDPKATVHSYTRPEAGQRRDLVIVERVRKDELPEYCIHGYATCVACEELCWLGSVTAPAIIAGEVLPLCEECGKRLLPQDPSAEFRGLLDDRLREDGPH